MKCWDAGGGGSLIRLHSGGYNVFLLTNGSDHILIDTGMKLHRWALKRRLKRLGIDRVKLLIVTHAHHDHAGNAAMIRQQYGAAVVVHRAETAYLESGENATIKGTVKLTRCLVRVIRDYFPRWLSYPACPADVLVDDKYELQDAGFDAYLLHTPGHTPGSMSLIVSDRLALAADARQLIESWKKLLATGCRTFLPAHGGAISRKSLERCLLKSPFWNSAG